MNIKITANFLLAFIVFTTSSCHFGFPDCEDDSSMRVLKTTISERTEIDFDEVEIFDFKETDLNDMGLGSNSFTCECSARYKASKFKGTINFSVTRKNSNYSTKVVKTQKRGYQKSLREGERDSLTSINKAYFEGTKKNTVEYLKFQNARPIVGQIHTLFINGEYSDYKLLSITSLYRSSEKVYSVDSTSHLDEYKFSELLFEFGNNDNICLYAAKLESSSLEYFDIYSYRINQFILIENGDHMQNPIQFLRCTAPPSWNTVNYIVLFKNESSSRLDTTIENRIWKVDLAYDENNKDYYYLYEESTENIQEKCWEGWR